MTSTSKPTLPVISNSTFHARIRGKHKHAIVFETDSNSYDPFIPFSNINSFTTMPN